MERTRPKERWLRCLLVAVALVTVSALGDEGISKLVGRFEYTFFPDD